MPTSNHRPKAMFDYRKVSMCNNYIEIYTVRHVLTACNKGERVISVPVKG